MPAKSTPKPARKRQPRTPKFSDKFEELIQAVSREKLNERTLETRLSQLFEAMGKEPKLATSVGGGEVDIHITDCNVIVECKASGRADPKKPGSPRAGEEGKTQQDQLFAYVRDMRKKVDESFDFEGSLKKPWVGILTDGQRWWAWEWSQAKSDTGDLIERFDVRNEGVRTSFQKITDLLFAVARQGKPHPPEEPALTFKRWEKELREMYLESKEGGVGIKLKYELWLDILKASGMAPKSKYDREVLFVKHSHLVVLCKAIISSLSSDTFPNPKALLKGSHGGDFTSWILEAKGGETWIRTLTEEVAKYDWRADTTDVLRRVYESVIPAKDRKAYGEYYTPDWLAEMLVEEILKPAWIESATEAALEHIKKKGGDNLKGIGVLDPSCGSGTFLYHAARRILAAENLKDRTRQEQAECVALLVHGLDIHPVAVEMARATLLRALPAMPDSELSIHQGDSLLSGTDPATQQEHMYEKHERIYFPNAENPKFDLPKTVVFRNDFNTRARNLVNSAIEGEKVPPSIILRGLQKQDREAVKAAHAKIRAICKSEGNSIWFWLIVNMVAPYRLSEAKVNRILANPPWVRMSDIPVLERKEVLQSMAERLKVWTGGRYATGVDIAAIFILRCGDIYLSKEGATAAAWLTNRSSVKGGNWQGFRDVYNKGIATEIIDFSHIKEKPFHGAASCAWIQVSGVKVRTAKHKFLENKPNKKIKRTDPWSKVKGRTHPVVAPSPFSQKESDYCNSKGVPLFRQGATLVPYCLVSADPTTVQEQEDGRMEITTLASRQNPWKKLRPRTQTGSIPKRWLIDTVRPRDALPFCLRPELSRVIVPINADGGLEKNPKEEEYWEKVENIYTENKGVGKSTPQALMARLNFNGELSAQLPLRGHSGRIIYNAAGKHLRASRCPANVLLSHSYYWYQPANPEEIPYLLALLNAACLQLAFAQSRKSDRDFCTYFWQSVPLPKYQLRNPDHKKLVELGRRAEGIAQRFANQPRLGQVAVSKVIRKKLVADGVMGEIDAIVRKLLPRHTTSPSE